MLHTLHDNNHRSCHDAPASSLAPPSAAVRGSFLALISCCTSSIVRRSRLCTFSLTTPTLCSASAGGGASDSLLRAGLATTCVAGERAVRQKESGLPLVQSKQGTRRARELLQFCDGVAWQRAGKGLLCGGVA